MTVDVKQRPATTANSLFGCQYRPDPRRQLGTGREKLQIGDSVVRTITMVAEGLDGAMACVKTTDLDSANTCPDPAEIDRTFVSGEIVGTRVETMTDVPTVDGNLKFGNCDSLVEH